MQKHFFLLAALAIAGSLLGAAAAAAGQVQVELVVEDRAPLTGQQDWLRQLDKLGVANLRIRAREASDKIGVEVRGTDAHPIYVVTAALTSKNDVVIIADSFTRRYQLNEAAALAKWLKELGEKGTVGKQEAKVAFGMTPEQFGRVRTELARPVSDSTKGVARSEVVDKIVAQMAGRLKLPSGTVKSEEGDKVAEELSGYSVGTVLAYVLRPAGLCLVPEVNDHGVQFSVVEARKGVEAWPVGWEPDKAPQETLPALYETFNANVQNVPVTKVLGAVGARLEAPILMDTSAMARYGIDPEKSMVTLSPMKTTYRLLLQRALSKAKLKSELRIDEAGKPLLWITTMRPL